MKSIISQLILNDNFIESVKDRSEEENLKKQIRELSEKLFANMDETARDQFDDYTSLMNLKSCYDDEKAFYLGFKSAVKVLSEVYAEKDD